MSSWRSVKARQILPAPLRIGWELARQRGSHRRLARDGWPNYTFAFHDQEEIGPGLLAQIAKKTPDWSPKTYRGSPERGGSVPANHGDIWSA
jgi:predicted RNA binding protein YcfA (HicA-like mRNA interferase family)